MADVNAQTGEPQNPSGWSTDGGDDASAKAAKALTVDSPMSKQYLGRMDALTADMEKNFAKQQEAEAPYRDKLMKVLDSPQAAEAHLEKVKEAPKPEDYQKYSMEFASAMAVIGAIGGKWTRNVGNSSLNAFAGALKGWQSGNQEAYENAAKEWQQNTQKTLENNRAEMEKYHEIINNKKLNIDQMMAAMNLVSAEYQNKIMFDATVAKNYTMAFSTADKMEMAQLRLQNIYEKFLGIRDEHKDAAIGQIDRFNSMPPEQQARVSMSDYMKMSATAGRFHLDLAPHPDQFLSGTQPRNAPAIAVQKFIQEHPDATSDQITEFAANYAGSVSAQRTAGTRAANIEVSAVEAAGTFRLAKEASDALPRGQFVPITRIQQMGQAATSNPQFRQFVAANESAVTAYGATMSRNGVNTVAAQQRAHTVLDTADSPQAYAAGLAQLQKEVDVVERAPAEARKNLLKSYFPNSAIEGGSPASSDGWGEVKVH